MKTQIKGIAMFKGANEYEMNGQKGISYFYDLYQQGETEMARVKCSKEQYERVQTGKEVVANVNITAQEQYGDAVLRIKQLRDTQKPS